MPGDKQQGFADAIEAAQRAPGVPPLSQADAASPFSVPLPTGHRVVDGDKEGRIPGAIVYKHYTPHVKLFNAANEAERTSYEEVLAEILNGAAILRYEERHFTKEGDALVLICWLTYKAPEEGEDDEDEGDGEKEGRR